MKQLTRREALRLTTAGVLVTSWSAAGFAAPAYPSKPIQFIVPFAAGGAADALARMLAQRMGDNMHGTFIVENRPGAGGSLGTLETLRAPADGYTILLGTNSTHAINPAIYSTLKYDVQADFAPITTIALSDYALVVPANSPYKTVAELIKASKTAPIHYASTGNGTTSHLCAALIATMTGADFVHVPYKTNVQAMTDTIGGQVDFLIDNLSTLVPQAQSGKLRILATTGHTRNALTKDVPTMIESGLAGYEIVGWWALFVASATPKDIQDRLVTETSKVVTDVRFQSDLRALGIETFPKTQAQTRDYVASELIKFKQIVDAAHARIE